MFYIYAIAIPLLILFTDYVTTKPKPKSWDRWVSLFLRALPHEWCYVFFLYYLEGEFEIDTYAVCLGMTIFLLPITVLLVLIKLIPWVIRLFKKDKKH